MGRSARDTSTRKRCGVGRTERDFALLISNATRTLTRGTATRECMSRSWAVPERLASSKAHGNLALWRAVYPAGFGQQATPAGPDTHGSRRARSTPTLPD